MAYRVGIVGATGAVGQELLRLLHDRRFPAELRLLASSRSAGKQIYHRGETWSVGEATPESFEGLDLAIFAASSELSKELAPEANRRGCVVVDNSSAFRMDETVPLVIPEINGGALTEHRGIVANPNCTAAVSLMGLYPLHQAFGLKRFVASSYQAVSGAGAEAMEELQDQLRAWARQEPMPVEVFPHQIAFNLIPQVDKFLETGMTGEEHKYLRECVKITNLPDLRISVTCVRVPVLRAHSVAISAEFERPVEVQKAREAIEGFPGVELCDEPSQNRYPTPLLYAEKEACGVGRLRLDPVWENGLAFWVVGDQLWKGAALNAVQIAEALVERELLRVPT